MPLTQFPDSQILFRVDTTAVVFVPECDEVLDMVVVKTTNVEGLFVVDLQGGMFSSNYQTSQNVPRVGDVVRVMLRVIRQTIGGNGVLIVTAASLPLPEGRQLILT